MSRAGSGSMPEPAPVLLLRPASGGDEDFFAALYRSTRDDLLSLLADRRYVDGLIAMQRQAQVAGYRERYPDAAYLVLELDGQAAGRLVTACVDGALRVIDLAVMPWARRQGVARETLRRLQQEGLDLTLAVRRDNAAARGLYAALGFMPEGEEGAVLQLRWRAPRGETAAPAHR